MLFLIYYIIELTNITAQIRNVLDILILAIQQIQNLCSKNSSLWYVAIKGISCNVSFFHNYVCYIDHKLCIEQKIAVQLHSSYKLCIKYQLRFKIQANSDDKTHQKFSINSTFSKVWWHGGRHTFYLFCLFQNMHSESHSYNDKIQSSISICRGLSPFPLCACAQWGQTSLGYRAEIW
jgi:hypothetical protein